jgi:hypothetical protein
MKLIICDPNLERASGHHWFLDSSIAEEAATRGIQVTILANRSFPANEVGVAKVVPTFNYTCYARQSHDPVTGEHDDFRHFNDALYEDLLHLPLELFGADTLVLFPTVTQRHLYGAVRWMKDFPTAQAPTFVVYLMLPSGIELKSLGSDEFSVIDPLAALQYRLAFDLARQPGPSIHFFGTGLSHAREFSLLAGQQIDAHPVVLSGMTGLEQHAPRATSTSHTALLFMGDAKEDKGFTLLPALVESMAGQYPGWKFLVHANCQNTWGVCKEAHQILLGLSSTLESFEFHDSFITSEQYAGLLARADLVLAPYSPEEYWRKSSGVVWESIWCGLPAVVPKDTWLDLELQLWRSDGECFSEWNASSIEFAMHRLIDRLNQAVPGAQAASKAFRRRNSLRLLINQLSDIWMQRMSLSAVSKASSMVLSLPLDKLPQSSGWYFAETYEGRAVRWMQQQITLDVELDPDSSWRFTFEGMSLMGDDQVTRAVVTANGRDLSQYVTEVMPAGHNPRWRIQGLLGPAQTTGSTTRVVLSLPYVYRPEGGDIRELGLLFSAPIRFVRSMEGLSRVSVGHPLLEFEHSDKLRTVDQADVGYSVREWAAASVLVDPTHALDVVAEVAAGTPVHLLQCSVNGVPAIQRITPLSQQRLLVVWQVPAAVVRSGGRRATLIFVNPTPSEAGVTLYGPPYACAAQLPQIVVEPMLPAHKISQAELLHPKSIMKAEALPASGVISFSGSDARPYMKDGWGHDEPDHVWMLGHESSLEINMANLMDSEEIKLKLDVLTLADIELRNGKLTVLINNQAIGKVQPNQSRCDFELHFSPDLLTPHGDALVTFVSDISVQPVGDQRELAISFYSIALTPLLS